MLRTPTFSLPSWAEIDQAVTGATQRLLAKRRQPYFTDQERILPDRDKPNTACRTTLGLAPTNSTKT